MKTNAVNDDGTFTIECQFGQGETVKSPDGTQHYIPCECCLELNWKPLNVISFECPKCQQMNGSLPDKEILVLNGKQFEVIDNYRNFKLIQSVEGKKVVRAYGQTINIQTGKPHPIAAYNIGPTIEDAKMALDYYHEQGWIS